MKRSFIKKALALSIAGSIVLGTGVLTFADEGIPEEVPQEEDGIATEEPVTEQSDEEITVEVPEETTEIMEDACFSEALETEAEDEIDVSNIDSVEVSAATDLQTQIDEAENGSIIVVDSDLDDVELVIPADKEITLDLNGHTLNSSGTAISNEGVLTITGNGSIIGVGAATLIVNSGGLMTIENGFYGNTTYTVLQNDSDMVINGGKMVTSSTGNCIVNQAYLLIEYVTIECGGTCIFQNSEELYINDGDFTGDTIIDLKGSAYLEGGVYTASSNCFFLESNQNSLTIEDGSYTADNSIIYHPLVEVSPFTSPGTFYVQLGTETINGGSFFANDFSSIPSTYSIQTKEGRVSAYGYYYNVITGTYTRYYTVNIEINGGLYEVNSFGNVTINNATILNDFNHSHSGAKIRVTDSQGNALWYTGTYSVDAIRNAETGSDIYVYDGEIITNAYHDVTVTVASGASVYLNTNLIPDDGVGHVIHVDLASVQMDQCLRPVVYYCSDCDKYYEDAEGTIEIADINSIAFVYEHTLTLVPEKPATTTEEGYEAYYVCDVCGEMFSDSEGNNPITEPVVIPKIVLTPSWKHNSTGWWYQRSDGTYPTSCWEKIDGVWYHFNDRGYMETGWIKDGSSWYYCDSSGAMKTGWVQLSGKWYYLKSSGAMATGWTKVGSSWYYMNSSGVMQTGWLKLSGKWYYLESSGKMVTGNKKIDGKNYTFNSSGVCLNP